MSSLAAQFERDGFLVLPDFHPAAACRELMERGRHLSENYRLDGKGSVFQTSEQTKTSDAYFLESGERISFFFENFSSSIENSTSSNFIFENSASNKLRITS